MTTLSCSWCNAPNVPGAATCASCGAPLREEGARLVMESVARALPPDTVLRDGDYKILAILGQGGFGITYRALNSRLGREVAIKEFFPSSCDREGLLVSPSGGTTAVDYENGKAAFLSEARVLARFDHPAIVRVFGAWEENRSAYMEMELLRGQTLAQVLEQYRRLSPSDVLRLFSPILDALQVLHNEGYLHRDIKPQNLMLCGVAQGATDAESCVRHARAVLLDFGAAHHVGSGASQALSVVVTPGYAPLEQYAVRARRGAFTDIYALCATLYHALSGQAPPPASDRAIGQALTPLEDLVSGLPKEWYRAIDAGLQTEIAKRPQSIGELRALMGGQNPSAPPPYQPYQTGSSQPYGTNDLSALINPPQSPPAVVHNSYSQAQSVIAQSLMNAVPDPNAPQVLAPSAPNLNPQHPLGASAPGTPVVLSQPTGTVPLVPPQASQNAIHQSPQSGTAHQHAQNQTPLNNSANDVRMRQVAALLYLGSPIVFALLWWLFAVSQGPHNGPPPMPMSEPGKFIPPPITRPYNPPPSAPVSSPEGPKMQFSMNNSAQSQLSDWNNSQSALSNTALAPNGNVAVGLSRTGDIALWEVSTGFKKHVIKTLSSDKTAHFSFAPDSSKLLIREIPTSSLSELGPSNGSISPIQLIENSDTTRYPSNLVVAEVKSGKILWEKAAAVVSRNFFWTSDSQKLQMVYSPSSAGFWANNGKSYGQYPGLVATRNQYKGQTSPDGRWNLDWSTKPDITNEVLIASPQSGSRRTMALWSLPESSHFDTNSFRFSPDYSWVMGRVQNGQGSSLLFRDLKTGKVLSEWKNEPSTGYGREFDFTISPKGRYVIIHNGTNALRIWDVRSHKDVVLEWGHWNKDFYYPHLTNEAANLLGNRVIFSSDESKMFLVDNSDRLYQKIFFINIATQAVSEMKRSARLAPLQLQFTPDGKSFSYIDGTSGKMGRLKLSDFKTVVPVQVLAGGPPTRLRYSFESDRIP